MKRMRDQNRQAKSVRRPSAVTVQLIVSLDPSKIRLHEQHTFWVVDYSLAHTNQVHSVLAFFLGDHPIDSIDVLQHSEVRALEVIATC